MTERALPVTILEPAGIDPDLLDHTLSLRFDLGQFDPRITFTRNSSATYFGSDGLLKTAAANVPRIDHDPVTKVCKGFLVEESRTNLLTYSEQFDNVAWLKQGSATVTANTHSSPDGAMAADTLNLPTSGDRVNLAAILVSGATTYTFSVWLSGSGTCYLTLNTSGGVFKSNTKEVTLSAELVRYDVSITTNADNTGLFPIIGRYNGVTGAGTATIVIAWGAQLEVGAFPTSYIKTEATAATRAADSAVMTGTNFSSWYRQDEGTFVAAADSLRTSGNAPIVTAQAAGGTNRHQMVVFSPCAGTVLDGVAQALIGANATQTVSAAYAYKANDFAVSVAGGAPSVDMSGTVPTAMTYMTIGKYDFGGAESLNGHVRRLTYYPKRLPNAKLQALTQ